MIASPSNIKIIYHHFTPEEVRALYRLLEREWIRKDDDEITQVVNRICKIVEADDMATRDNQTT